MANASVNFNNIVGRIKPMNAVNNGPIIARKDQSRGNDEAFAAARIPYARTHDSSACQNGSVDMLMYYDASPCVFNGLFDYYTLRPMKGYYPLYYFGKLLDMKNQTEAMSDDNDIRLTAAADGKSAGVMISYFAEPDAAEEKQLALTVDRSGTYKCYTVNADLTNAQTLAELTAGEPVTLTLQPQTVIYLEI